MLYPFPIDSQSFLGDEGGGGLNDRLTEGLLEPKFDALWDTCREHFRVYSQPWIISLHP